MRTREKIPVFREFFPPVLSGFSDQNGWIQVFTDFRQWFKFGIGNKRGKVLYPKQIREDSPSFAPLEQRSDGMPLPF
jgi:hypothetical protein